MESLPWVEKYRPKSVSRLVHQSPIKRMLERVIAERNMPHCIFYGPPGSGKTSAALALCRELYGETSMKKKVLELNASDDRGISVIREKVKSWTRLLADKTDQTAPDWKIVILDEADMMTADAQSALRRIMEDFAKTTRFIIICNYIARIIDPINSRCAKFRFRPIPSEVQIERLLWISEKENMSVDDEAVKLLHTVSEGDLRLSVTLLQTCRALTSQVTVATVETAAGIPPLAVAQTLVNNAMQYRDTSFVEDVLLDSWDIKSLLSQIFSIIVNHDQLIDLCKARIITALAEAQFRLSQGASESVQLYYVISTIIAQTKQYSDHV